MTEMRHTFQLSKKKPTTLPTPRHKTILRSKILPINVIHEGKNVTPKPLNPELLGLCKERQISVFEDTSLSAKGSLSTVPTTFERSTFRYRQDGQTADPTSFDVSIFGASFDFFDFAQLEGTVEGADSEDLSEKESLEEVEMKKAPTNVSLTLTETETFFILDMPSCTALKDTEEGDLVEEKNREYEYLTEGKGRNRRVVNAEAQTLQILKKSRNTMAEMVKKQSNPTFASNWEMYDTFHAEEESKPVVSSGESDSGEEMEANKLSIASVSLESYRMSADEKHLSKLAKNNRFLEAVCVIERLLSNNCFYEEQKRFRGLSDPDDSREDIEYNYRLNLLWTFANGNTKGRCVSCFHWNPSNEDLLAVGYGKFYFAEQTTGMVMVWNIKNPVQPERTYNFANPVTTLKFSAKDPNLLAVGFYNGYICILNIANREMQITAETVPSFEVIWDVQWRENPDTTIEREQIYTTSDDGRVMVYTSKKAKNLEHQQIMRIAKADGKLKGYDSMRKCSNLSIPVSRYASARFLRWHPSDPSIYLVGTNEGVVHKCSTSYLDQHLDLFLAHEGPINDLKYSPFTEKIYATCGDDWYLRLWAEGIPEPLHELSVSMTSVQGMDWSPTHSTILATIYGKTILLWDFQRKFYKPQSETLSPTNSRNTVVEFVKSGRCLVVGDIDGNVHVFSLEDMPFPAFFQENLLFESVQKSLVTEPIMMQKIRKMRRRK